MPGTRQPSFNSIRPLTNRAGTSSSSSQLRSNINPIQQAPTLAPSISILFSPHGPCPKTIAPIASYLAAANALPLSALLHPFDTVVNPVWLGGTVNFGIENVKRIAKSMEPSVVIKTHDEEKVAAGFSTKWIECKTGELDEARQALDEAMGGNGRHSASVYDLAPGEALWI
jgi:hypothetical protein